ncbi:sensor domain-containing protein [Miltoncostaea marina]|uniref:sensor domain-containing protein n=1 Tax=Miltoncostaea marina TaxID=2843215 RepID=UPI001C3DC3CE|nr:sensor domain-containing protein [Miltoncostaea marina]
MTAVRRHLIEPLRTGGALRALALVASAIPLGTLWFVVLVTGWAVGLGLLITLVGLPILLGLAYVVRVAAEAERRLLEALTGERLARRPVVRHDAPLTARLRGLAGDATIWREQAYLLLRFVLGLPLAVVVLALLGEGLRLALAPAYYRAGGDVADVGAWSVDTFSEAVLLVPAGLALAAASVPAAVWAARAWTALARGLLGEAAPAAAAPPADGGARPGRRPPRPVGSRGLAVHAAAYAIVNVTLVLIWTATTPGGYFWPFWTLVPLGAILLAHAALVVSPALVPGGRWGRVGLVRHAGVAGALALLLIAIWAFTTPGGYFWPVWPVIALAVQVAIHATRVFVGTGAREDELTERIDVLTSTRAGAVDAQAAELRRIERDLHDGAQARLVALAMDLGMARDRLAASGDARARDLVAGAHEEAKRALVELRDLARGIHPAVLSDRGLEAAVGSLAGASRIPVRVEVDTGGRLEPAVEAAAYFTVAESLANAAKHSGARVVEVAIGRGDGVLRVRVSDDGAGGADPQGEGLTGLRRRIEAHDGILRVVSPEAGGTTIEAVIPCGS